MVRGFQVGQRVICGAKFDTHSHLVGIDLLVGRGEDGDKGRVFTLLVGVPFLALKLSVRTAPMKTGLFSMARPASGAV